jgi:hypothetical protein
MLQSPRAIVEQPMALDARDRVKKERMMSAAELRLRLALLLCIVALELEPVEAGRRSRLADRRATRPAPRQ